MKEENTHNATTPGVTTYLHNSYPQSTEEFGFECIRHSE